MTPLRIAISLALIVVVPVPLAHASSFEIAERRIGSAPRVWTAAVGASPSGFLAGWTYGDASHLALTPIAESGRKRFASGVGAPEDGRWPAFAVGALGNDFVLQTHGTAVNDILRSRSFRIAPDGQSKGRWETEISLEQHYLAATTPSGHRLLYLPFDWNDRLAVILDDGGRVIGRPAIPYARTWLDAFAPITSSDEEFVFAWWDESSIYVHRITASTAEPRPTITVASGPRFNGAIPFGRAATASNGREVLVIYNARQDDPATAMKVARISAANEVVQNTAFRAPADWVDPSEYAALVPAIVRWTGDHYVAIRTNNRTRALSAIRLDVDGNTLDSNAVDVTPAQIQGWQVANRGDRFYITYLSQLAEPKGILGTTFRSGGGIGDIATELLSLSPMDQRKARIATDGAAFLAVWNETDLGTGTLRATVFDAAGMSSRPTDLPATGTPWSATALDVAWGGGVYVVVWLADRTARAARITASGVLLDPQPIVLTGNLDHTDSEIHIASNGSRFLVVWSTASRFEAVTLSPDGGVGEPHPLRTGPPASGAVLAIGCCGIASDGDSFLVLWTATEYEAYPRHFRILAQRAEALQIDAGGTPATPAQKVIGEGSFGGPLVWNGREYAFAHWNEGSTVMLRRLDRRGDPIGAGQVLLYGERAQLLDLDTTGGDYQIVYVTERDGVRQKWLAHVDEDSTTRVAFGPPHTIYENPDVDLATNAAGETVIVSSEVRPGALGARGQAIVAYVLRTAELPPARRRATRR